MHQHRQRRLQLADGFLDCEWLEPDQPADACVVWLHGLGASGDDFVPVVPHLKLPADLNIRFIFPHAPAIPVTCNGGYIMPAWYDILELSEIRKIEPGGLLQSRDQVNAIIDQQVAGGITPKRIIVIGFSQGGAVAYHAALTYPQKLGGLIALSTYLPMPELLEQAGLSANQTLPIRIAHGDFDDMVTERASRAAFEWLQNHGYNVTWQRYPMAHEVCITEIRQIGGWIGEMLAR